MNNFLKRSIRWLVPLTVIAIFASYAVWMGLASKDALTARGQLGDSFGVLNSLFSGLGFAGVVITIWIQQNQIKSQEKERVDEVIERRSLFNLNAAIEALQEARQLLEDNNNDRRTWIEAARLLGHAKVLGEGVIIDCHQRALETNKLRYRTFFSELLSGKTEAFFYGVDPSLGVDQAAIESCARSDREGRRILGPTRHIEEASIYRVWEAAQWPENFVDPLGQTFSEYERASLIFDAQGLQRYLEHRETYYVVGEELRREPRRG